MSKQVRLTDLVVATIETEMQPRETYSEAIERILDELHNFRRFVRVARDGKEADE